MKRFLIASLGIIVVFAAIGQDKVVNRANNFIATKKYESGFKLLDSIDPKNSIPAIVLLKEKIALNYFVSSIMHQMFAFKDISEDENIIDYRGKEGSFGMFQFPINNIIDSLIKVYPDNYELYKGLGDFYYEVQQKYGKEWLIEDSILSVLIEKNYQIAIEHNLGDDHIYYVIGFQLLSQKKNKEAIPYLLKSVELKSNFADANYNLAYAYLFTDDRGNALKYAKKSFELYNDSSYKGDAARMIGEIYEELKDDKNAIANYEVANKFDMNNYHNMKPLLYLYVKTDNTRRKDLLNSFYNLAPDKSIIYNDLEDIYFENKKKTELIEFYKMELLKYEGDKKISGNLNFYLGRAYLDSDKQTAKKYFSRAKDIFATIYEKDDQVFKTIEELLKQAEN